VEREGRLVGGMPVVVQRRGPWQWWHALPFLLPGTPLAAPGEHEAVDRACARAINEALSEAGPVGGEWVGYRPGGPSPLAALETVPGETRTLDAYLVDLSAGLDVARARLDRETRRGIRQARERGLELGEDAAALEEGYALHRAQAREWPGYRPLPLELSRRLLGLGGHALLVARARGDLLAAVLALASPHEAFGGWSGARPETRASHAYAALLWAAAEWAAEHGCRRLNLGASVGRDSVEDFKRRLGAQPLRYPVRWIGPAHAGLVGRWVGRLQARRRHGRDRGRPT
jgi:hypothetical protein